METTALLEMHMYLKIDLGKTGFLRCSEYGKWLDANIINFRKNHVVSL